MYKHQYSSLVIKKPIAKKDEVLHSHRFIKKDGGKWPNDVLATRNKMTGANSYLNTG